MSVIWSNDEREPRPETKKPTAENRPDEEWGRGTCPQCGEELVSNAYYVAGQGYKIVWECWGSLREVPTCSFRRTL